MSSKTRWFDLLRDFAYAVELYCEEKKESQHPPAINVIKVFAGTILRSNCESAVGEAMKIMISSPIMMKAMRGGLMTMNGKKAVAGEFFKTSYDFKFVVSGDEVSINFYTLFHELGGYSRTKKIIETRRQEVNIYLANTLAECIKNYIINYGFQCSALPVAVRESILINTTILEVDKPYSSDYQSKVIKDIINDALDNPTVTNFMKKSIGMGDSSIGTIKDFVDGVGSDTYVDFREGVNDSIRARSINPLINNIKKIMTDATGGSHVKDDISAQMQM